MEFGRITNEHELDIIDFNIPQDHAETTRLLTSANRKTPPQIFTGCAKWGRTDWVGKIFPKGTKESDFLKHYARQFNCVELNATYYNMPSHAQMSAWKNKVGDDFLFCPKFSKIITHDYKLNHVKELTDRFLEGIAGLGKNLGPLFLMPHPGMGPRTQDSIEAFILSLPSDIKLFVELRHEQWFSDEQAFESVFTMLERYHAGAIITDTAGRRDCMHMRLTTADAFIRFVGNGLHTTDYTRIDAWVQRIKTWMTDGIERVYFFMHQHDELHSPELIKYLIQQLNKHCGTTLHEPVFVQSQPDLFGNA